MISRRKRIYLLFFGVIATILVSVLVGWSLSSPRGVRGKAPALPLTQGQTSEQTLAQDLALADNRVQYWTVGRRSEVLGVLQVGQHFTEASQACAQNSCWQVNIYNFDENATVSAIVDVDTRQVWDVLYQPDTQPGINKRLADLAMDIALNDPKVIEALGYQPTTADTAPMHSGLVGSSCDLGHLCAAPTFRVGERLLWAVVDLTDERLAGISWTEIPATEESSKILTPEGCPSPGSVSRDGWELDYEVTGTDALRVYNVTYYGVEVMTSVKLAEWHADYGASGFVDSTGCGGGGGGFPIYPYGDTQVLDLLDDENNVIGFEVVQDFRMSNWGNYCNYRYEQHDQFFLDGRFRVVAGAFGKGCGDNAIYRPLVRIDIAVAGDVGDSFAIWDGIQWAPQTQEAWWLQGEPYTSEGYKWLVTDQGGSGYYLEPGQGQFGDAGRGDNAFIYTVLHHPAEGDTDLGVIGSCCNDDYQQGPHNYLNGESIENDNIVIWYVPQSVTDAYDLGDGYYCWTITGEPNPETYPCFAGPMFIPFQTNQPTVAGFSHNAPVEVGDTVVFTSTSTGPQPLIFGWDFGDGVGASNEENPTYAYDAAGVYTVTLTVTSTVTLESDTAQQALTIGYPPVARFEHNDGLAVGDTAVFTNTSTGSIPLSFLWDLGDGTITDTVHPTHSYDISGTYTVTLTATNSLSSSQSVDTITVGLAAQAAFDHNGPVTAGFPAVFTNRSTGATAYEWDFGDGIGLSSEENPIYVYSTSGTYTVTLTASNQFGGSSSARPIEVYSPILIYIPLSMR